MGARGTGGVRDVDEWEERGRKKKRVAIYYSAANSAGVRKCAQHVYKYVCSVQ